MAFANLVLFVQCYRDLISALRGSNCSVGDIFHGLTVQGNRCVVAVKSERRGKFQFSRKRFDFEGIMILL